jgi:hypothetical protein
VVDNSIDEALAGRCDKIAEILSADPDGHGLSAESIEKVAWYLAERERELAPVFAEKGKKPVKSGAPRGPKKSKAGAAVAPENAVATTA